MEFMSRFKKRERGGAMTAVKVESGAQAVMRKFPVGFYVNCEAV
jgi:hypothetical protein